MKGHAKDAANDWGVIVDHLHESIITTDADGFITNWNKGAERLFGYSAEEAIGRHAAICHERNREMLDLAKIENGSVSLDLKERVPEARLPLILVDTLRFRQALLNLLSNAGKYNRAGGEVTIDCLPVKIGSLRISVADTGQGIPEHVKGRVFEPFDRLGGKIGFESTIGKGTTFWIDVLVAPPARQPAA